MPNNNSWQENIATIATNTTTGTGGPATIADGADVAQGTTTDAAGANTVVGQVKQVATNTTGLATASAQTTANTSLATIVTQTATPNVSDRWARQVGQVDLARVLGATLSASNPAITENNIQNFIRNSQGYTSSTGLITATNAAYYSFSVFNPSGGSKTLMVSRLAGSLNAASNFLAYLTTTDPAYTTIMTPANLKPSGAAATASVTAAVAADNHNSTFAGTLIRINNMMANTDVEMLKNGSVIVLAPGNGVTIIALTGAGSKYALTADWVEF